MFWLFTDITEADDPYYRYLLAYYQPYERYLQRLHQLYPNITLPKVQQTYNPNFRLPYSKQIKDGVIILQSYEFFCTIRGDLCNLLFTCPPCSPDSNSEEDTLTPEYLSESTSQLPLEPSSHKNEVKSITSSDRQSEAQKNTSSPEYDPYDIYEDTVIKTEMPDEANNEGKLELYLNIETTTRTENKNPLEESKVKPARENTYYNEYTDEDVIEDDKNDEDLLPFDITETPKVPQSRSKRQVYQIYPVHSQEYCVCSTVVTSEELSKTTDFKFGSENVKFNEIPETFLKLAKGCTQLKVENSSTTEIQDCSFFQDEIIHSEQTLSLHLEPLSRKDFEKCCRFNISATDCLKVKQSFLMNFLGKKSKMEFNDDGLAVTLPTSDSVKTFSRGDPEMFISPRPTLQLLSTMSPIVDKQFEAGVGKWLGPLNADNVQLYNGISNAIFPQRRSNPEISVKGEKNEKNGSVTYEVPGFLQPSNTLPEIGSSLSKTISLSRGPEQSLVSLLDPELGVMPKIAPPTVALDTSQSLENEVIKIQDVKTNNESKPQFDVNKSNKLSKVKAIRPQKNPHKLVTNRELLSSFTRPQKNQCIITGVDAIFYVDDVGVMPESEFNAFRRFLTQFYNSFETKRQTCERVSRIGILKTNANGDIFTYLHLDSPLNMLQKSDFISKMSYGGCLINKKETCRKAIVDAYVLASNMQMEADSDRKKIFFVVTARSRKQIRSLYFDLREAVQHAAENSFDVYTFSVGTNYNEKALKLLTTTNTTIIPQKLKKTREELVGFLCEKITVSNEHIKSKSKYCPWNDVN